MQVEDAALAPVHALIDSSRVVCGAVGLVGAAAWRRTRFLKVGGVDVPPVWERRRDFVKCMPPVRERRGDLVRRAAPVRERRRDFVKCMPPVR